LKTTFVVAFGWAGLEFEEKNVQLLAIASVFDEDRRFSEGPMDLVGPKSGQRYDTARGTIEEHAFLPAGMLLVEEEGNACIPRIWLCLDTDCSRR